MIDALNYFGPGEDLNDESFAFAAVLSVSVAGLIALFLPLKGG